MSESREFTFRSVNGNDNIYVHKWLPAGKPRAVLQIAHGVDEHIMRYNEFAEFMAEKGFLVVGNDHLGHGRSVKSKDELCCFGEGEVWKQIVHDMHTLLIIEKKNNPCLPYFMLGHSMGSFLTRTFLISYPKELDGAVLSGTGQTPEALISIGLILSAVEGKRLGAGGRSRLLDSLCFGAYNKNFSPAETPVEWLTRDREIIKLRLGDEYCGHIPAVSVFKKCFTE